MAEFKLGRIRFVWKGDWTADNTYYQDDVVAFGSKTYICVIGHTSDTNFFTDLDIVPSKWNLVSDGQSWKGTWQPSTEYVYNDIVSYGARLYICNTIHTSAATAVDATDGLEADQLKWDLFAEGIDWKGNWVPDARYRINDLVKYGGTTYICNTLHVSASSETDGLEVDQEKWDYFNQGIEYKSEWTADTRYKVNDLVRYGAGEWICTSNHTSSSDFSTDVENWEKFVEGFQYENDWSPYAYYQPGDVVRYGGNQYIATISTQNAIPTDNADTWDLFSQGFRFLGDWNEDSSNQHYKVGEVVRLGGFTYVCIEDHETGQQPPNDVYWKRLNEGFRWRGEWLDDQEYFEGDVTRYGDNSYVCIKYHISEGDDYSTETLTDPGGGAQGSRPDLADSGQYWAVIAIGSEQSVLTTKGDLVYYSGTAPTRLPVGLEGQVLQVNSEGVPNWEFLQSVEDVYYVAEHGQDLPYPEYGSNIDRPFKSIRYACEQIEKGAKNPNAQYLLDMNRVFIQEEVTSWINYQIDNAVGGSIWENFEYGEDKCKRDVGFIIDRIKWDLGHGGNLKTRAATQTYLNALADGPYSTAAENNGTGTYNNLETEYEQDVASYNYMLEVIQAVLNNEAPTVIYQNVTDDSTAIVDQFVNTTIEAEAGSYTRLAELVGIVTTALASRDTADIPEREVPQTLVKVSTGKHYEVLPIVVPAYCAILGDELRSTHIIADSGSIPKGDSEYTVEMYDRISDIVGDIVVGTAVTPTTGNNEVQSQEWPLAITEQSNNVSNLVKVMKYQTDYRLNTMHSAYVSEPVSFIGSAQEIARENLKANIDFLVEEVIAFLDDPTDGYPNLKYGKTDTRRDARYIIDALIYDLTYGGNSMSVLTGQAYHSSDGVTTTAQIPASIKTETIAAINYLKTTAQSVAGNVQVTSPYQETVEQTLTGNVGSITEIADNVEDIIDILDNGLSAVGSTTTLTNVTLTNGDNTTTALISAFNTLTSAINSIQGDTITWINMNYPDLTYNSSKCSSDVVKLLEAVRYDFALNSNYRTIKAAHAYLRKGASDVYTLNQKAVTRAAIQYALLDPTDGAIANVGSDATAIARITESAAIIDAIIFSATNEGSVCQTQDANAYYAMLQLERNRDFIVSEVTAWMNYNYVDFDSYYTSATCARDIGYIVDAVSYDLITGSNFASSVAGRAYYRNVASAATVTSNQLKQTIAAVKEARRLTITYTDSTLHDEIATAYANVLNILENGSSVVPTFTFPDNGTTTADGSTSAASFQSNRATIISNVSSYLNSNYNTQWTALGAAGQATCQRDIGYIIDAATFDVAYGGNYQSVIAGDSYYSYGTLQIGAGDEKIATLAALAQLKSELSTAASGATEIAAVEANMDDIIAIVTNGAGTVTTTYPSDLNETPTIQNTFAAIQADNATIQTGVTTYITNTFSSYTYDVALCERDVNRYIDALKMDLMYPGNYSSRYVARYYANAVTGSQEEDMFYLRDATGVRNCTLNGLDGQLAPENEYGYSQVTAGAYCSLDPGFGPEDFRTWIITRSPYIQGVTTFGNAATGQKIDGALHNGGNDSMVSNDFTQVISDGIGAHILNNGRAELVSVFTYYSHIGYLAETGGRIRATNGNNSYGDFGSVATGVDADETPVTAVVDNETQYKATVANTLTDNDQILQLEYNHAGNDYTQAVFNVFGSGSGAEVVADEFRDNGLNYVFVDQNADPDIPIGGSGYVVASNVAQTGTTSAIFLAATDGALSSAYIGMKVYIIGGAGVGQYGVIDTYNAGSKEATIVRDSDGQPGWDHVIPGTAIEAPNASSTYQIEPRITFSSPTKSDSFGTPNGTLTSANAWHDFKYFETSDEYIAVTPTGGDGNGATFDVIRNGEKYYLEINSAGTGYTRLDELTIAGTDVGGVSTANDITITVTSVNSVTGAIVDYDFTGYGRKGLFLAVGDGTTGAKSYDGGSFQAEVLPSLGSGNWASIGTGLIDDGSSTYKPSAIVVLADGSAEVAYSTDADNWSSTTLPGAFNTSGENSIAFGQIDTITSRFVAISDADTDIAYSDDGGATWTLQSGALPATGYGEMAYGAGRFVAINSGTTSAAYSNNGIAWTGVTAPASFATVTDIVYGNGRFVALGGTNGIMYSFDGTEWFENDLALPQTVTERKIAYGQGVFVITSDSNSTVQYSEDGIYWQVYSMSSWMFGSGEGNLIAFGNTNRNARFVAIPNNNGGMQGLFLNIGATAKGRASIANEALFEVRITEPGSGYTSAPTVTVTDPNNINDVDLVPQLGNGVLGQPTMINRGSGYLIANAEVDAAESNGNANYPQTGAFIAVKRLTQRPVNGSNVEFSSLPGDFYKLVNVISFLGANDGSYTAFLQLSPSIAVEDTLPNGDPVEMRIRFSQVRLTGHDFLDIGTGGYTETNYPGTPVNVPDQTKETSDFNGGRVFYTSTDQDGNFRVGDLFTIEQSTGVATLNAEAFNIAGLQELQLGEVTLGGNSASITEFSTDPFFTANSDNIVPTQRAIKAYIEAQIGGGGATLNVNSVTAGDIFIGTDTITSVSGNTININGNILFSKTVLGLPLAYNYFLR
jgi:hypothetical protein